MFRRQIWLTLAVVLGLLSLIFAGFYLLTQTGPAEVKTSEDYVAQRLRKSPQDIASELGYKIIKVREGDHLGRTVVYEGRGTFDGAGTLVRTEGYYLVGEVMSLSNVPGGKDYVLSLQNPISEEPLVDVRLVSSQEATKLNLERLELAGFSREGSLVYGLDAVGFEFLQSLLRPGDVVAVVPRFDEQNNAVEDGEKRIIAESVVIRRFGTTLDQ